MKGVMTVIVLAALCACTSHTRYYTSDGTRVTEIERTTHIGATPVGATPPAPLVRGVQEDVPANTGPALPQGNAAQETAPNTGPALPSGNVAQETAPNTGPALPSGNVAQEDVPANTGSALPSGNVVQEDVPANTEPFPPDKGGPRGVLSTDSPRQDIP